MNKITSKTQFLLLSMWLSTCAPFTIANDSATDKATTSSALAVTPANKSASSGAALDQVISVLDNDVILDSDIQQGVALVLAKNNANTQPTQEQLDRIKLDIYRQIALRKLQLGLADRMGITVDEPTLNEAVLNYAHQQGMNSIAELEQQMNTQGSGMYFTLREQLSDEIKIARLRQQQVSARVKVTEKDVDNFIASPESQLLIQPEYQVIHVTIDKTGRSSAGPSVVAQQIQKALLSGKSVNDIAKEFEKTKETVNIQLSDWVPLKQFPTAFADQLKTLDKDGITKVIETSDKLHVFKVVDRRGGDHNMVTQWKVRHILISPTGNLTATDAKTRVDNVYQNLTQGQDFSQLAKTYSNDPGSARAGGSLGWVSPGEMVPAFEAAMSQTPVGQYSKPFQSPFGWHILQVQEVRKQDMADQYRRNAARRILFDRKFDQEYENWLRELKNTSYINVRIPFYQSAW